MIRYNYPFGITGHLYRFVGYQNNLHDFKEGNIVIYVHVCNVESSFEPGATPNKGKEIIISKISLTHDFNTTYPTADPIAVAEADASNGNASTTTCEKIHLNCYRVSIEGPFIHSIDERDFKIEIPLRPFIKKCRCNKSLKLKNFSIEMKFEPIDIPNRQIYVNKYKIEFPDHACPWLV